MKIVIDSHKKLRVLKSEVGGSETFCRKEWGYLSHFHCNSKASIFIDFRDKFERNASKRSKNIVSKVSLGLCLHSFYDSDNLPL